MKQFFSVLFMLFFISGLSFAQDAFKDEAGPQTSPVVSIQTGEPQYDGPEVVLYDNGGLVNYPGGGFGGNDASVLETPLGLSTYGFGAQVSATNSMADDFVVPAPGWQVDEVIVYAYQTGSTTTSTFTEVRVQIWDGDPTAGGTVIFGDLTTNRMTNTTWSNIYRSIDTAPLADNRPIMENTASLGVELTPGTYWIEYQFDGTAASGPWAPPITILNTAVTGNAKQNQSGSWVEALSGGFAQGMPFILMGSEVGGGSGTIVFEDNFDSYTAGIQLACQNPVDWTTWSNAPCGSEDGMVVTTQAASAPNSVNIIANNDQLKLFPQVYITGIYSMAFKLYIATGLTGYFNCLSSWNNGSPQWAMQVYFNMGGQGNMDAGGALAHAFTYPHDTWMDVEVIADLDNDVGEFWLDGTMEYTWVWSTGTFGTGELSLEANNFFGGGTDGVPDYYFDDYVVTDLTVIPVELTSFTAISNNGNVQLNWETATEVNNQGFEIERRTESSEFRTIAFVEGAGTITETRNYSYIDKTADQGINYYRLKQVDFNGTYEYSDEVEVDVTGPLTFNLAQNYPNPFNPTTNIQFSIPESGNVKLSVYNLVGEEVAVLVNGFRQAGTFEVNFDASNLSTGVYLYKLQSANSVQTMKMMLLK